MSAYEHTQAWRAAKGLDAVAGNTLASRSRAWLVRHGGGETVTAILRGLRTSDRRLVEIALASLAGLGLVRETPRGWVAR